MNAKSSYKLLSIAEVKAWCELVGGVLELQYSGAATRITFAVNEGLLGVIETHAFNVYTRPDGLKFSCHAYKGDANATHIAFPVDAGMVKLSGNGCRKLSSFAEVSSLLKLAL